MRRVRVARVDCALRDVQFRSVRDVAQHARLRAGTEQSALGPFKDFDSLKIRSVNIQIASR